MMGNLREPFSRQDDAKESLLLILVEDNGIASNDVHVPWKLMQSGVSVTIIRSIRMPD